MCASIPAYSMCRHSGGPALEASLFFGSVPACRWRCAQAMTRSLASSTNRLPGDFGLRTALRADIDKEIPVGPNFGRGDACRIPRRRVGSTGSRETTAIATSPVCRLNQASLSAYRHAGTAFDLFQCECAGMVVYRRQNYGRDI